MKQNKLLITTFAIILALPALDSIFHFSPVKDLFEKRQPVAKPDLPQNFTELKTFSRNFEKYFNDNYGFRKSLVSLNSQMMDKVFDESPDARAVVGKHGWFYFDNHNSLLDARGMAIISDEMIERGVKSFGENWKKMREKNIDYLLIIAADKSTIYPEFLPDYIKPNEPHRIDKFLNALKAKYPDFPVVDLRPTLKKAKENEVIYHKTDTHWNRRGAHYGYVEIAKALKIKPHLREDFLEIEDEFIRGDISDIMGVETTNRNYELTPKFTQTYHRVMPTAAEIKFFHKLNFFENSNKNLPVIFGYQDSYFGDLFGYMSEHFSKSFYDNEFPCDLNYEILKNYHPNVVIQEFWEGRVEVVLSQCK
jgi:alginate O-acetyltransferase complex protein AlgJ